MIEYEVVAAKSLGDDVKAMSLRAILPSELLLRIDADQSLVTDSYERSRKRVEGYVARAIAAQRRDVTGAVPVELGAVSQDKPGEPLTQRDPWTTVGPGGKPVNIE